MDSAFLLHLSGPTLDCGRSGKVRPFFEEPSEVRREGQL